MTGKIALFFFITAIITVSPIKVFSGDNITIGYYNPDISYPASEIIKTADNYYKKLNINLSLQPISNFDNISRLLFDNGVEYLIMPPLFVDYINQDIKVKLRLEAVDKYGSNSYSKYILIKKDSGIKTVNELANKLIASSSYGKISEEILNKYIFSGSPLKTDNVDILWVKKDLDGIFALVFGQVEAAIVAPASYELLSKEKPEFSSELTIVYTSGKIYFPCLYSKDIILNSLDGDIQESFLKMNENGFGMELLKIFGIEKWKKL